MIGIYTLPKSRFSRWVETNDADTNLSEIQVTEDYCIVPMHIYQDSLIENDFLDKFIIEENIHIFYNRKALKDIQETRANSYRACIWYQEIIGKIPTAESILLKISSISEVREGLENNIEKYPFVKLCTMSAKDKKEIPIYNKDKIKDALDDLICSDRTNNLFSEPYCFECEGKHLFMRMYKKYLWEARCFWSRDKLRAVSMPNFMEYDKKDQDDIIKFFNNYGKYFPYHSATVDIGMTDNGIELIEFNTFGPDMKASAGNFSWFEDVTILLYSPIPVFR